MKKTLMANFIRLLKKKRNKSEIIPDKEDKKERTKDGRKERSVAEERGTWLDSPRSLCRRSVSRGAAHMALARLLEFNLY